MVFKSKGGQTFSTQEAADAADLRIDTLRKSKSNVVPTTQTKPVTPVTEANLPDPMALEQGATTPVEEKPVIETPTKVETPVTEKPTEVKPVEKLTEPKKDEVTPVEDVIEQKKTLEKADYQDDSIERLTQIKQNLDNYATTSPNLFDDYADYKDFFKFDQRSNTQKKLLENAFNQNKYTKLFRGKSVSDIGDMLLSGTVTGNDLQSLNTIDPTVYGAVQDYIKKANDYESANSNITGEGATGITTIANKLGIEVPQDINLSTEYDKLFNTDEIKNSQTELADKESAINLKKEQLSNIRDTVLKQYEGTGMTTDAIDAIVADKTDNINKELTRMGLEYNNSLTKYNNAIGNATNKYNAIKDQITINQNKFENSLALYKDVIKQDTEKSQTVTNPVNGLSYEKQADGSWKQIDFGTSEMPTGGETTQTTQTSGTFTPPSNSTMRTDRHNNPTAMTIDVAKQGGLIEGIDYEKGDPFTGGGGQTYYTARLLGDALASTRKVIDKIGFTTAKGNPRRSYLSALGVTNESWANMNDSEKNAIIAKMYKHEGGKGTIDFGTGTTPTGTKEYTATQAAAIKKYLEDPTELNYNKLIVPNGLNKNDVNLYKQGGEETLVNGFNPDDGGVYQKYLNGTASKADYEQFGGKDNLSKQAAAWYKNMMNQRFSNSSLNINDTFLNYYKTQTAAQKTKIDDGLGEVGSIVDQTDTLLDYLQNNGVPSSASINDWAKYKSMIRKLQLSAKSENIFNLGVLNGPDLDVLNDILPASRASVLVLDDEDVKEAIISYRNYLIDNFNAKGISKGLSYSYNGKYPTGTFVDNFGTKSSSNVGAGAINQNIKNAQDILFGK